ncbi:Endopolyphosphatase [Batrachochytrium dendrobatidis]|nr:Endopolyphosphatase [Batrachochytrium dendrobatidis]
MARLFSVCVVSTLLHQSAVAHVESRQQPLQFNHEHNAQTELHLSGRFLHLTDIHLDVHYQEGSSVSSDCYSKKNLKKSDKVAGFYGAPGSNCDSPVALVQGTFQFVKQVLKNPDHGIDFVVWTGDNSRHDKKNLRIKEAEVAEANRIVTSYIIDAFSDPKRPGHATVPVLASIGNNDIYPHNRLRYSRKADTPVLNFFADLWAPFIPKSQDATFRRIGSYMVELTPNKLWGVSLNTLYLASFNGAVPDCRRRKWPLAFYQTNSADKVQFDNDDIETEASHKLSAGDDVLNWLEVDVLIPARNRNISVYISGHVPPNVVNYGTDCYSEFSRLTFKYRDIIRGQFYGHMNIDHFFFTTPDQVLRRYSSSTSLQSTDLTRVNTNTELVLFSSSKQNDADENQVKGVVTIMSPSWVMLYFEYLILHYKVVQESKIIPQPIFVSPSVVPVFNPGIRVYIYDVVSDGLGDPNLKKRKNIPATRFGTLLDYEQYYADLEYWNRVTDVERATSVDGVISTAETPHDKSFKHQTPRSKYLYELEYNSKSLYDLSGHGIDTKGWLDLAKRLGGSTVSQPKRRKKSKKSTKKSTGDDQDETTKDRWNQQQNSKQKETRNLRRLFFSNMIVHLKGLISPFGL